MLALVVGHDPGELEQLAVEPAAGDGFGVERRLQLLQEKRVVEDLGILTR